MTEAYGDPRHVCLVCQEFAGPTRCGGVGTAFRALADRLAAGGHRVTVLLTAEALAGGTAAGWTRRLCNEGIDFFHLPRRIFRGNRFDGRAESSYNCYQWLKNRRFDIIHFSDWMGLGYYTLLARAAGLGFADTIVCVGLHGPEGWAIRGDGLLLSEARHLEMQEMERASVGLADICVSPSRYMADWMAERSWRARDAIEVIPNIVAGGDDQPPAGGRRHGFRELVFFGRLEPRKGLYLFCDAVDRLFDGGAPVDAVTFLGAPRWLRDHDQSSDRFIERRCARWPARVKALTELDTGSALDYLARPGRLAVLPSRVDNSPYTVAECLARRLPFICTDVGGVKELLPEADREQICFRYDVDSLGAQLRCALANGVPVPGLPAASAAAGERWLRLHETLPGARPATPSAGGVHAGSSRHIAALIVFATTPARLSRWHAAHRALQPHLAAAETPLVAVCRDPAAMAAALPGAQPEWIFLAARDLPAYVVNGYVLCCEDTALVTAGFLDTAARAAAAGSGDFVTSVVCKDVRPPPEQRVAEVFPIASGPSCGLLRAAHGEHAVLISRATLKGLCADLLKDDSSPSVRLLILGALLSGRTGTVLPEPLIGRVNANADAAGADPRDCEAAVAGMFERRLPRALAGLPRYALAAHRRLFARDG